MYMRTAVFSKLRRRQNLLGKLEALLVLLVLIMFLQNESYQ